MSINRKGHVEVRPTIGDQLRVYAYGSNGQQLNNSERLTSRDNVIKNIVATIEVCNGTHAVVRDYTKPAIGFEEHDYKIYIVRADGTVDTNFPEAKPFS
jgi:hypothetical protein